MEVNRRVENEPGLAEDQQVVGLPGHGIRASTKPPGGPSGDLTLLVDRQVQSLQQVLEARVVAKRVQERVGPEEEEQIAFPLSQGAVQPLECGVLFSSPGVNLGDTEGLHI